MKAHVFRACGLIGLSYFPFLSPLRTYAQVHVLYPMCVSPASSHNYGKGLAKECAWVGTGDYSSYLSVPAALKFVDEVYMRATGLRLPCVLSNSRTCVDKNSAKCVWTSSKSEQSDTSKLTPSLMDILRTIVHPSQMGGIKSIAQFNHDKVLEMARMLTEVCILVIDRPRL